MQRQLQLPSRIFNVASRGLPSGAQRQWCFERMPSLIPSPLARYWAPECTKKCGSMPLNVVTYWQETRFSLFIDSPWMNWSLLLFQLLWVIETYNNRPVIVSWLHNPSKVSLVGRLSSSLIGGKWLRETWFFCGTWLPPYLRTCPCPTVAHVSMVCFLEKSAWQSLTDMREIWLLPTQHLVHSGDQQAWSCTTGMAARTSVICVSIIH